MFRTALISMFLTSTALATTWTVDDDGKADFDNIRAALEAASDGDEIIVMPGTYTETVDLLGKEVWLHSSNGSEVTFINAQYIHRGIVCVNGEGPNTRIEGFTVMNAYTDGTNTVNGAGAYIYGSSPTIIDCTFENNYSGSGLHAGNGGGMYNIYSSPTLINCTFTGNTADYGGGMYNHNSSPTLTDCTFTNNTATYEGGGGMLNNNSSPTLTNCTFENNTAANGGWMWNGSGGGMYNINNSSPTLTDCTFTGNSAESLSGSGGGDVELLQLPHADKLHI